MADIAARVRRYKGVLLHADAVQAASCMAIDVNALDVDLLSIAAHKFEGPKGVGALYVRHGTNVLPQQQGGAQERYRRAGTEDVAGSAGMARALELAVAERAETVARLRELRESLTATIRAFDGVQETGHPTERLPGLASFVVAGLDGSAVAMALDLAGLACSNGSACVSGSNEASHVLRAMGYPEEEARGALRLSLGRTTTAAEIAEGGELIVRTLAHQREASARLVAQGLAALGRSAAHGVAPDEGQGAPPVAPAATPAAADSAAAEAPAG
jgi:cysteine desulfurase